MTKWVPVWWQKLSTTDKILVITTLISLVLALITIGSIIHQTKELSIAIAVAVSGCLFWFLEAPDPRFGYGFIIGLQALVIFGILKKLPLNQHTSLRKWLILSTVLVSLGVFAYTGYRFKKFFVPKQWTEPLGIENGSFQAITCQGIEFHLPLGNKDCGTIGVPCVYQGCDSVSVRGENISDGFKPAR